MAESVHKESGAMYMEEVAYERKRMKYGWGNKKYNDGRIYYRRYEISKARKCRWFLETTKRIIYPNLEWIIPGRKVEGKNWVKDKRYKFLRDLEVVMEMEEDEEDGEDEDR